MLASCSWIARIQHVVFDLLLLEELGKQLGFFDRGRADEHRLAALVAVLDQLDDGVVLLVDRSVDLVVELTRATGMLVGMSNTSRL